MKKQPFSNNMRRLQLLDPNSKEWARARKALGNEIHRANLAELKKAAQPMVGPFWYQIQKNHKVWFYSFQVKARDAQLDNSNQMILHSTCWPRLQEVFPESLGDRKYYEIPRGRVYILFENEYRISLPQKDLNNPDLRKKILSDFNLPENQAIWEYEPHFDLPQPK